MGAPHARLVWRGRTDAGAVQWHCLVVSVWLDTVAHSVGPHSRPSGKATAQSPLFHRPGAAGRRDRARLHETLESGNDLRGKSRSFRHRDENGSGQISRSSARLRCSCRLYSLVTLFGSTLAPNGRPAFRQASWYQKSAATFSDILAVVRHHLWGNFSFPTSRTNPNVVLLPRSTLA